ncbi:2'-5'-oligoadenylate synthase 1-like isoform X2 [Emydura macquarii macquarii]|uniref:2'-5'-oligoadenylate synthase 1-like isoform X2 n=1 Tax=Emydura macquarii macquarii TaxID=1129001 RepID=UPI00352A6F77
MELYQVPASSLDAWVAEHLQPSEEFRQQVKDIVRRICDFLKETCFDDIKVLKTVKGGSAGKGTALKNNSDADLVLFLDCFSSYQDQVEKRASVLGTIEQQLSRCQQTIAFRVDVEISQPKAKHTCPRSLSITIQSKKRQESIEVDVLPAYDALGHVTPGIKPSPQVYEELIRAGAGPGDFCTSFTELQRDFVKRRPAKLKNLLRLIKHWYKELSKGMSGLPPKYALELLTIYAWEVGTESAENFSTAEGFRTVMELLRRYRELCIFWTEFYDLQSPVIGPHVKQLLRAPSPVILDPADPTGTLGQGKKWDLLAKEAAICQAQMFCKNGLAPIRCWNVQRLALQEPGMGNQPLLDDQTLASYSIFYDTTILMLTTEPQEMEIFVKDQNSRTSPYAVCASDTVLGLKKKIEGRTGVTVSQQILTFNSKELQDSCMLSHYGIRNKSTVYLLLRLRGG